jgi:hypothetical protein
VYDKGFFVGLDIDMDSEEGLGRTGRLNSQPKKNYIDNHLLLTYEKFSFGFGFRLRAIDSELAIVAVGYLSWKWDDCEQGIPFLEFDNR